jgi:hypothetical protein
MPRARYAPASLCRTSLQSGHRRHRSFEQRWRKMLSGRTAVIGVIRFAVTRYGWPSSCGYSSCQAKLRLCVHLWTALPDVVTLPQYCSLSSLGREMGGREMGMAPLACFLRHKLQDRGEARDWLPMVQEISRVKGHADL